MLLGDLYLTFISQRDVGHCVFGFICKIPVNLYDFPHLCWSVTYLGKKILFRKILHSFLNWLILLLVWIFVSVNECFIWIKFFFPIFTNVRAWFFLTARKIDLAGKWNRREGFVCKTLVFWKPLATYCLLFFFSLYSSIDYDCPLHLHLYHFWRLPSNYYK